MAQGYNYVFLDSNGSYYQNLPKKYQFTCPNCYIIRFEPKTILPNTENIAPPNAGLIDKGIHETAIRMNGIIYVDKDHLFIKRHTGELGESFNIGPLGIARITMASLNIEQEFRPDLNNLIVLTSAEMMYQARKGWIFGYETRSRVYGWSNFLLNK